MRFNRYYQQELNQLRDLGAEFAQKHPAVAPMLSGMSTDPDVERLLEGVAFLTAMLRQKLDDDFPEIVHELFQLIWPHYLRPLPASSIVAFTPKANLKQIAQIPKGTQLASVPVDGTTCLFKTCYDVDIHPLTMVDAALEAKPGKPLYIRLVLELQDIRLDEWQPEMLRFYLAGDHTQAANLFLILCYYLRHVVLGTADKGQSCLLPSSIVKPAGFAAKENLIPYPFNAFPGYRIIQEYFLMPEKFLFFDLYGWQRWQDRGKGTRFEIRFELKDLPFNPPKVHAKDFVLGATPVINLFTHDANPIRLDHTQSEYLIRPYGDNDAHFHVYAVQKVTGFVQGSSRERAYQPFEAFAADQDEIPIFHTHMRRSPVRPGFDFYLSVAYPQNQAAPLAETLSVQLECTNGFLPEGIQIGDICLHTSTTPEFVEFNNIRACSASIMPPMGRNLLWQLLSHLCLNYRSLASVENLKALLELYNFEENRNRPAFLAHQKRIAGIEAVHCQAADRLVDRVIMRGREIQINLSQDHFAGLGDLFLFGSVLDYFLGAYASMNTYTQLSAKEVMRGEVFQWPARIGDHPLI